MRAQPLAGSSSTQTAAAARRTDEPVAIASAALARALPQNIPTPASSTLPANPAVAAPLTDSGNSQEVTTAHVGTAAPAVQRSEAPPAHTRPTSHHHAAVPGLGAVQQIKSDRGNPSSPGTPSPKISAAVADSPECRSRAARGSWCTRSVLRPSARGKVSLQAVVGYDGAVNRVRGPDRRPCLAAAAIEAVRQWRYEPFSGAAPHLERETNITISFISNEVVAVSFPSSAPLSR